MGDFFRKPHFGSRTIHIELLALRPPQTAVAFSVKVWHLDKVPTFKRHQQWVDLSRNWTLMI